MTKVVKYEEDPKLNHVSKYLLTLHARYDGVEVPKPPIPTGHDPNEPLEVPAPSGKKLKFHVDYLYYATPFIKSKDYVVDNKSRYFRNPEFDDLENHQRFITVA